MSKLTQPVSLRLDKELLTKAAAFAKRRKIGVTTALRLIISERLEFGEAQEELDTAMRWQRERVWEALQEWDADESKSHSMDDLRKIHADTLRKARKK
jgi:hypothetical protein